MSRASKIDLKRLGLPMRVSIPSAALLGLGLHALLLGPAAAAQAVKPGDPIGRLILRVCRTPGLAAVAADRALSIPAGTTFAADQVMEAQFGGALPVPAARAAVTTLAAASIAAERFCATVPVRPARETGVAALRESRGRLFLATGSGAYFAVVYGSLEGLPDALPANPVSRSIRPGARLPE